MVMIKMLKYLEKDYGVYMNFNLVVPIIILIFTM